MKKRAETTKCILYLRVKKYKEKRVESSRMEAFVHDMRRRLNFYVFVFLIYFLLYIYMSVCYVVLYSFIYYSCVFHHINYTTI